MTVKLDTRHSVIFFKDDGVIVSISIKLLKYWDSLLGSPKLICDSV